MADLEAFSGTYLDLMGVGVAFSVGFTIGAIDPGTAAAAATTEPARKASSINTIIPCKIFILNHPLFAVYRKDS
jgi:hypothetical protein